MCPTKQTSATPLKEITLAQHEKLENADKSITSETRKVTNLIRATGRDLESKYPVLRSDNLGLAIWTFSIASIFWSWYAYVYSGLSAWALVLVCALSTMLLHELEHDLIHNMHSRNKFWLHDIMFFGIMVCKMHASPWFRRELHLQHHQKSGQVDDAEERLIGLGLKPSLLRMAVTSHPAGTALISHGIAREISYYDAFKAAKSNTITYFTYIMLGKLCMALYIASEVLGYEAATPYWTKCSVIAYGLVIPNALRQCSLVLMSNTSHYYGNVPKKGSGILMQNQVIDITNFVALPAQILCCFFGATHMLHHLVPQQNFVTRTLVFFTIRTKLPAMGVKVNDLGAVYRANRHKEEGVVEPWWVFYTGAVWIVACQTIGFALFPVFDLWVNVHVMTEFFTHVYKYLKTGKIEGKKD